MKYAIIALYLASFSAVVSSQEPSQGENKPYDKREQGKQLIERLSKEPGMDAQWLRETLADARYQPKIVAAMQRPAEKVLPWHKYRKIFIQDSRIEGGMDFIREHAMLFKQVEERYGVPPSIIAAIIGVETRFGKHTGDDRVLDALATLGFDYPPRAKFFYSELEHFLKLCKSEGLDARSVKGSYAGAMGMPQFIASSYQAYAVDFNNNGQRDLWNEPADVIGSVANYFSAHGWQPGADIAARAPRATAPLTGVLRSERKTHYRYSELAQAGAQVDSPPQDDTPVGLLEFENTQGPEFWVGYKNFFVITSYNHSPLYAMAVYQLSQAIEAGLAKQSGSADLAQREVAN